MGSRARSYKMASILDDDGVTEGTEWELSPLFPGLDEQPILAKVLVKNKDRALVRLSSWGVTLDTVTVTRHSNSVSVQMGVM